MHKLLPVALLLILAGTAVAQTSPPPQGYRLHRVHRLRPAPLPPGGLVPLSFGGAGPYQLNKTWGLADTLGHPYLRAAFGKPQLFGSGPFMRVRLRDVARYEGRFNEWWWGYEVWVNAHGQYLLAPMGQAAYRQPDGSLRARRISRHLAEPQYEYELQLGGQEDTALIRRAWLRTHTVKYMGGGIYPVRHLGQHFYAVQGPALRWQYRLKKILLQTKVALRDMNLYRQRPVSWLVPWALFTESGQRLTPYKYKHLGEGADGRIRFSSGRTDTYRAGFLNHYGKEVLGPYEAAEDFYRNRAVVALPGADWQHPLYTLIDTSGTHLLPPRPGRLTLPDEAGLLRHETEQQGKTYWEYLRLDGQPAFPGRYFQRAEPFRGDSAAVVDATGRAGILRRDGSWQPAP